jgi:hypothetical protein
MHFLASWICVRKQRFYRCMALVEKKKGREKMGVIYEVPKSFTFS